MLNKVLLLLRMPDWFFAAIFAVAFPIYRALHQKRAYGRTAGHLSKAAISNCSADDVFRGIYWNAIDSYRGLARFPKVTRRIVFENEKIIRNAMASSKSSDGTPLPIAAISIHQGPFELLHRSLCRYSDNVHLITDSVGSDSTRKMLKALRSDEHLTEYHPDELTSLLRDLFTPPSKVGKKDNAILAMVIDQGKNTKGKTTNLFGRATTLYTRLPEKINQMGAGIVTFRTFTRLTEASGSHSNRTEIVIRFETFYPPKFNQQDNPCNFYKDCGKSLTDSIAKEVELWISEHPAEWSWNYHGNFRV